MEFHSVRHFDQHFIYTDHTLALSTDTTQHLLHILNKWQDIFPKEATLIQTRYGVPSLFVRFDFSLSPDGEIRIYEIQEGCAWVGFTGIANSAFREIRDQVVRDEWPGLKVLMSDEQHDKDDSLWLERSTVEEALENAAPLVVRNWLPRVSHVVRTAIISKSVRPVVMHNNKRYGIHLGWWKSVLWHETEHGTQLPWNEAFVLKPVSGHGSTDIMIWKPDDRTGRATRTQIIRTLQKHGKMYIQLFIAPMRMEINGSPYNFIYRPYFMYSGVRKAWVPAHGVWTARPYPNIRIHGASDTISGPLMLS